MAIEGKIKLKVMNLQVAKEIKLIRIMLNSGLEVWVEGLWFNVCPWRQVWLIMCVYVPHGWPTMPVM